MVLYYAVEGKDVTTSQNAGMATGASPFSQLQTTDEKFLHKELFGVSVKFLANIMELGLGARHAPLTSSSMHVLCWNLEWPFQVCGRCIPVGPSCLL